MSKLNRYNQELTPNQISILANAKTQQENTTTMSNELNLDEELEQIAAMVEQENEEVEEMIPLQEEIKRDVLDLLSSREDAPSQNQIDAWKTKYGQESIQLLGLDKDNVYIYTHLTLPQWESINSIVSKVQGTPKADEINSLIREKVIRSTVLWPELGPNFFRTVRAGLPDTLYQLILIHSYFLSPQQAITLTTQL